MTERVRNFLRSVQPWQAIVASLMLLALVLLVVAVAAIGTWLSVRSVEGELGRRSQQSPRVEVAPSSQNPPTLPAPETFEDLPAEQRPEIPGLAALDVVGYLKYGPGGDAFVCSGPIAGGGDTTVWECRSAPGGGPPVYEVRVTGDGPLSVFFVEATVYDASREQAAEFLGYAGGLAFDNPEPVNVRAWVRGNVSSGGQLAAGGAELTLYGTNEVRTLVVAGVPREIPRTVPAGGATVPTSGDVPPVTVPDELDADEFDSEDDG